MIRVFVYGTLLSGEYNNYNLANAKLLGKTKISGFEMHDLGSFPACTPEGNSEFVNGEVWEINDEILSRLDSLEGYPIFYDRKIINTEFGEAWIYFIDDDDIRNEPFVEFGDWKNYRKGE